MADRPKFLSLPDTIVKIGTQVPSLIVLSVLTYFGMTTFVTAQEAFIQRLKSRDELLEKLMTRIESMNATNIDTIIKNTSAIAENTKVIELLLKK